MIISLQFQHQDEFRVLTETINTIVGDGILHVVAAIAKWHKEIVRSRAVHDPYIIVENIEFFLENLLGNNL